ncbi:MAG: MmcQ/YjbR family DNA-binding protein [Rhizobiales bacterium]|nr:MmcQ/YjbR family DNA-binding protein [Hyphomicrobiales bacterium]
MTRDETLALALSLPGTEAAPHFERTAVKVAKGRIFATLGPDGTSLNVKLTPDQQPVYVDSAPEIFSPVPNAWGRQGWTTVDLAKADRDTVAAALTAGWRNAAPKTLLSLHARAGA